MGNIRSRPSQPSTSARRLKFLPRIHNFRRKSSDSDNVDADNNLEGFTLPERKAIPPG